MIVNKINESSMICNSKNCVAWKYANNVSIHYKNCNNLRFNVKFMEFTVREFVKSI